MRVALAGILLLLVAVQIVSKSTTLSQNPILLEIVYATCGEDCEKDITRVYADGRYVFEQISSKKVNSAKSQRVLHKEEKQLEAKEFAELLSWAEEPDFLNAEPEYVVTTVRDWPAYITITYRDKAREKSVKVFNFNAGNPEEKAKVPPAVMKLARWAQPYSFP